MIDNIYILVGDDKEVYGAFSMYQLAEEAGGELIISGACHSYFIIDRVIDEVMLR